MRFLFTFLIFTTVIALHFLDNPEAFRQVAQSVGRGVESAVYTKDIRIEGLKILSRTEVERLLPLTRSVVWWMSNAPVIQARAEESPWIESAVLDSCPGGALEAWGGGAIGLRAWGCFVLSITERTPRFIAMVDNEEWLIAHDGAFLLPLSTILQQHRQGDDEKLAVDVRGLTRVTGLASRLNSPDLLAAQLGVAREGVEVMSKRVGRSINSIDFSGKAELSVHFKGVPFPVVFSAVDEAVSLSEQSERCALVLRQFRDRFGEVEKIDLAFERVGVVKLKAG
jgi:hypothetical protein